MFKSIKLYITLAWFCLLGAYVGAHWLDPKLPADILNYQQDFQTIYTIGVNYLFFLTLAIASVGLWLNKKWGFYFIVSAVILCCLKIFLAGPKVLYPWEDIFTEFSVFFIGVLVGFGIYYKNKFVITLTQFRFLLTTVFISIVLVIVATLITDSTLPQSFKNVLLDANTNRSIIFSKLGEIFIIIDIFALIFLYTELGFAKYLLAVSTILSIIIGNLVPDVVTSWDAAACSLSAVLQGCVLMLAFVPHQKAIRLSVAIQPRDTFSLSQVLKEAYSKVSLGLIALILPLFILEMGVEFGMSHIIKSPMIELCVSAYLIYFLFTAQMYIGAQKVGGQSLQFSMLKNVFNVKVIWRLFISSILIALILIPAVLLVGSGMFLSHYPITNLANVSNLITAFLYIVGYFVCLYFILALNFVGVIIVKEGVKPFDAVSIAFKAVKSHRLELVGLNIMLGLIALVCALPVGLGLIWAIPFIRVCYGVVYQKWITPLVPAQN